MNKVLAIAPFNLFTTHKILLENLFWRSLNIFGRQGITFLFFFITARYLDPTEFGYYTYALTILYLISSLGDFGVSTAVTKQVAELINTHDLQKIKVIIFNGIILILSLVGLICMGLIIFSKIKGPSESLNFVLLLFPSFFLAPLTSLYDGIYRGKKRFKSSSLITLISGVFSLVILWRLIQTYGINGSLITHNIYYGLLLISLIIYEKGIVFKFTGPLMRQVIKYSLIIGFTNLSYFLYSRMDILILKSFGMVKEIGMYEATFKLISLMIIPFTVVSQVISPDVVKWYKLNRFDIVFKKAKKYSLITFFASVILVFMILPISSTLLSRLLPLYSDPETVLLNVMLITFIFHATSYVLGNGFSIFTGDAKLNAITVFFFGVMNVMLNMILVTKEGFLGISVTKLIVGVFSNTTFIAIYLWKLRQNTLLNNKKL